MMIWLIPLLPVVFAVAGLAWRRGRPGALLRCGAIGHLGLLIYISHILSGLTRLKTMVQADGLFYLDSLSAVFLVLIALISSLVSIYAAHYLNREIREGTLPAAKIFEYHFWINLLAASMYLVVLTANIGLMWVAIEATTVTSVLLVAFDNQKHSLEAAWKYVLICSVGIIFALIGIMLLYFSASHPVGNGIPSLDWRKLMAAAPQLNQNLIKTAFIFILIGFGTKVGFAPMHTWLPDAHSQAPTPVSAMLSGVLLNCALYGIIRISTVVTACTGVGFVNQFWTFFGLVSLAVAVPFILIQADLKRLLAYSSIENMGVIAFALGVGGKWGLYGALTQMFAHGLTKAGLFLASGEVVHLFHSKRIHKMRGLLRSHPSLGFLFFGYLLILSGAPPFAIFFSKMTIIYGALQRKLFFPTLLFLLLILAVFGGLLYHFGQMVLGAPTARASQQKLPRGHLNKPVLILATPVLLLAILGLYQPTFWRHFIAAAVEIIGGGLQ